ncbi:hypothetical protein RJ53_07625 [Methanocalculus chunghsingensis]|uniref:Dockerin domain-containing protein n=1 Tax=Methanocalculus chunghsingensis TaxID=156457 RepID=A0A8J8B4J0_9EURY|nr:hypothetical protein [Methanocalculus chunghsingensis]MBR1369370.1 hypothetical protein [Methanocalculus chunghsingensis]
MRNRIIIASILIIALAMIAVLPAAALSSIPTLPCEISGTVTINGEPAPPGAIVTAFVAGNEVARIIVREPGMIGGSGPFDERLIIQQSAYGEEREIQPGAEIAFFIHGYPADETARFGSGESLRISITQTALKGDLNGNGRVDIGDVSRVAYMSVGLVEEELRGDFSYDGRVQAADAARIAYFYVGKIPAL